MDAQRDEHTSDVRRSRNMEVVRRFQATSRIGELYLHYFVPLTTEVSAWNIDETTDCFALDPTKRIGLDRIFDRADAVGNNLPAWHQPRPKPEG